MELTTENVNTVFLECLFKEGENIDNYIKAQCIMLTVGFNPERLKANKENIISMLSELPEALMENTGGGISFLQMCNDTDGTQWTGLHKQLDELVALGLAIGRMEYLVPKELWSSLPGGMPYLKVNLTDKNITGYEIFENKTAFDIHAIFDNNENGESKEVDSYPFEEDRNKAEKEAVKRCTELNSKL